MRFQLPITAADADIDELDHVSNLVYLRWVLEVAMEHSRSKGWDHPEYRALGSVFIVRRHEIDYLAPVLRGEQVVAETWVASWKAASCVRATEIKRGDQVVLRAATTWVFVSYSTGKPQRIPEDLLAAFISADG